MDDLLLDDAKLEVLNFALQVTLAYTDEQIKGGHLNAGDHEDYQYCHDLLHELIAFFDAVGDEGGERVH